MRLSRPGRRTPVSLWPLLAALAGVLIVIVTTSPAPTSAATATPRLIFPGQYHNAISEWHVFHIQNVGTAAATVRADWYAAAGNVVLSREFSGTLAPGAGLDYASLGEAPERFRGTLIISADQPLAGNDVAYRAYGDRVSISGRTGQLAMPGSTGSVVSLPYLSNNLGATYNTTINLANAGDTTACVTIRFSFVPGQGSVPAAGKAPLLDGGPGGGGCTTGYPIAARGSLIVSPDDGPGLTPYPATTADTLMAATVTSTGSAVVAVVDASLASGPRKAAAYEGFFVSSSPAPGVASGLGTDVAIPVALKTSDGYYSQILVSNPGDSPAAVSIAYRSGGATYTASLAIPAGGVANHSVYSDSTVPVGFIGAARVTSDKPVAAVLFRSKMTTGGSFVDEDLYTAVNGSVAASASKNLHLPTVARRLGMDASQAGMNSWLSITVPGGGEADVTLKTEARAGAACPTGGSYSVTKHISGSFVFYQNADSDNGFGANPPCVLGSMSITSSVPILAVSSFINDLIAGDQEANFQVRPEVAPSAVDASPTASPSASPSPSPSPIPAPFVPDPGMLYQLKTKLAGDGKCLTANELAVGGAPEMKPCTTAANQLWRFTPSSAGVYRIAPVWPGSPGTLGGSAACEGGAALDQTATVTCTSTVRPIGVSYDWRPPAPSGTPDFLRIQADAGCLSGGTASGGTAPRVCDSTDQDQLWKMVPRSTTAATADTAASVTYLTGERTVIQQWSATKWAFERFDPDGRRSFSARLQLKEISRGAGHIQLAFIHDDVWRIDWNVGTRTIESTYENIETGVFASTLGPGWTVNTVTMNDAAGTTIFQQTSAGKWEARGQNGTALPIPLDEISRSDWEIILGSGTTRVEFDFPSARVRYAVGSQVTFFTITGVGY